MSEGHPDEQNIESRRPGHEISAATEAADRVIRERVRPWAEWVTARIDALEARIDILESPDGGTKPPPPPPPPPPIDPEV
jgi:hypothetical protein